jgi:FdhD protein
LFTALDWITTRAIDYYGIQSGCERKMGDQPIVHVPITKVRGNTATAQQDELAVEEPLLIRVGYYFKDRFQTRDVSVTMRTPGHDCELAAGFLFTEGLIQRREDIAGCRPTGAPPSQEIQVDLDATVDTDFARLERHFYTSSSCGVCGKTSLEAVESNVICPLVVDQPVVDTSVVLQLPERLREAQSVFQKTGGLHASALFERTGSLIIVREDVGRHNALDKLIGAQLLAGELPLAGKILLVSGRASFELVQKALMAGIAVMVAVGAPSSLAVQLARRSHMTLAGFVRNGQFNIYSGPWRIQGSLNNEAETTA